MPESPGEFLDRETERKKIAQHAGLGLFGYMTGRRRVGKSALLETMCNEYSGFYHQAIEGTASQQIEHLVSEIKSILSIFASVTPKTWVEFFTLLAKEKLPPLVVFDEFPYWVNADPTLPSILQKWLDHELKKQKTLIVVSGSSQAMLHSQFLDGSAPLYGRARFFIDLKPMSYSWFCKALRLRPADPEAFEKFAVVGGVPRYWKLLDTSPLVKQLDDLFFEPSAILSEEPRLILHDEGITGNIPKAILDLVGRGVNKPSEIAGRMGIVQNHLSRPFALLIELGLIHRDLPFGESLKTSKKVLYSIQDAALAFYYGTAVPHRHHWRLLSRREKQELVTLHVSRQFEIYSRKVHTAAQRYWEPGLEIDLIALLTKTTCLAAECKWTDLSAKSENAVLTQLKAKIAASNVKRKTEICEFKVYSKKNLAQLAQMEDENTDTPSRERL